MACSCWNSIFTPLKPTYNTISSASASPHQLPRLVPRASASINRRQLIAETAAAIALPPLLGAGISPIPAKADEVPLSEWERVYLPIDPGVVLLDIAFVPDDPTHGLCYSFSSVAALNAALSLWIFA